MPSEPSVAHERSSVSGQSGTAKPVSGTGVSGKVAKPTEQKMMVILAILLVRASLRAVPVASMGKVAKVAKVANILS